MADSTTATDIGFKNLPHYPPLMINAEARQHLVVSTPEGHAPASRLIEQLPSGSQVTWLPIEQTLLDATASDIADSVRQQLMGPLREARLGLHLYVLGSESFLWQVHAAAIAQGLCNEEISLYPPGDQHQRLVYCVHCSALQPQPWADSVRCPDCAVLLEVRAHFSRRLGAYLGVCLNAGNPYGDAQR